jgi:hypothetical protein
MNGRNLERSRNSKECESRKRRKNREGNKRRRISHRHRDQTRIVDLMVKGKRAAVSAGDHGRDK